MKGVSGRTGAAGSSADVQVARDNRARILVVNDVADHADPLSTLLEADGYLVRTAFSARHALLIANVLRPQCILLDVNMPGMDGWELAGILRRIYGSDVLLIATTGLPPDRVKRVEQFKLLDHHLHKPIDHAKLREILPPS